MVPAFGRFGLPEVWNLATSATVKHWTLSGWSTPKCGERSNFNKGRKKVWRREWDSQTRYNVLSTTCRVSDDTKGHGNLLRHAVTRDRMVAAGKMQTAILSHAPDKNGLRAD